MLVTEGYIFLHQTNVRDICPHFWITGQTDCKFCFHAQFHRHLSASKPVHSFSALRGRDYSIMVENHVERNETGSRAIVSLWFARATLFVRFFMSRSYLLQNSDCFPKEAFLLCYYEEVCSEELLINDVDRFFNCTRLKWDDNPG